MEEMGDRVAQGIFPTPACLKEKDRPCVVLLRYNLDGKILENTEKPNPEEHEQGENRARYLRHCLI